MFDHIRAADRAVLLLNTVLLMVVAFLPVATSVLAGALRSGDGERAAVVFCGIAFAAAARRSTPSTGFRSARAPPAAVYLSVRSASP